MIAAVNPQAAEDPASEDPASEDPATGDAVARIFAESEPMLAAMTSRAALVASRIGADDAHIVIKSTITSLLAASLVEAAARANHGSQIGVQIFSAIELQKIADQTMETVRAIHAASAARDAGSMQ